MTDLTQEKFLTDSELQSLVNQLNKNKTSRDALLIFMALYTGARCREVLNIKKKDIVKKLVTIRGIKKSNDRIIPIPDDFYHDLLNYMNDLENDDLLFPITTRYVRKIWDIYRPNPDKGFHCLRHTMGVRLYKACKDIYTVKAVLGHKSLKNTMIYMNYVATTNEIKKGIEKLWSVKDAS